MSEHAKVCCESFDFENAKTLAIEGDFRLRKIREALEIRMHETAPNLSMATNKDRGNILRSETWNALMKKIRDAKT